VGGSRGAASGFLLGELSHPAHRPTGWKQLGEGANKAKHRPPGGGRGFVLFVYAGRAFERKRVRLVQSALRCISTRAVSALVRDL
jgi:hypothetical protein